jgi:hypothetical protein
MTTPSLPQSIVTQDGQAIREIDAVDHESAPAKTFEIFGQWSYPHRRQSG